MYVPEVERRGLLQDIRAQRTGDRCLKRGSAMRIGRETRGSADTCVHRGANGQCSPATAVSSEVCVMQCDTKKQAPGWVSRIQTSVRAWPRSLQVGGTSAGAAQYQRALGWWQIALEKGVSASSAPRAMCPTLSHEGYAFALTTGAAREAGTGFAGFTFVRLQSQQAECWYLAQLWDRHTRQALHSRIPSAGDAYGAVALLDAILSALPGVAHLICFLDGDATAKGLIAAESGAPQPNFPISWLCDKWGGKQLLGVHQTGVHNDTSAGEAPGLLQSALTTRHGSGEH